MVIFPEFNYIFREYLTTGQFSHQISINECSIGATIL